MFELHSIANYGTAIFSIFAAFFWFISSVAKVKYKPQPGVIQDKIVTCHYSNGVIVPDNDLIATIEKQSFLNSIAAFAAAIAAILQGVALIA